MMEHWRLNRLSMCVLVLAVTSALASVGAADVARISIQATDVALGDALTDISTQTGVQMITPAGADLSAAVDLDLNDVDIEEALREVASQANCSWVRIYLLEPKQAEAEQYTFGGLLKLVRDAREGYARRLDPQEREALEQVAREAVASARTEEARSGVGFYLADAGDMTAADSDIDVSVGRFVTDPLHFVTVPRPSDPASIRLTDADLTALTDAIAHCSSFVVLDRLQAAAASVSLDLTDAPVDDIVAAAAEQLDCGYRRVYLFTLVNPLTAEQVQARMDTFFHAGVGFFWSQPPEKRAELVRTVVERAGTLSADDRRQIRSSALARQMMGKFVEYCNSLPMDQRREMMPLLQEAARLMGQ